jgi:hypothetical protein
VRDLVHDRLGDDGAELLVGVSRLGLDRRPVERDAIGQRTGVVEALRLRDALVEAEELLVALGGTVLDEDRDVVHRLLDPAGKFVQRIGDERLEPTAGPLRHRL